MIVLEKLIFYIFPRAHVRVAIYLAVKWFKNSYIQLFIFLEIQKYRPIPITDKSPTITNDFTK